MKHRIKLTEKQLIELWQNSFQQGVMHLNMTFVFLVLSAITCFAQDDVFDEDALFGDTATVIDSGIAVVDTGTMKDVQDEKTFGVSGEVTTVFQPSLTRAWFQEGQYPEDAVFSAFTMGALFMDARLPGGFKAFANSEVRYDPVNDTLFFSMRELFLDANIKHRVYFRAGKQVLQWGRCFFWNPTDLINIEKKQFIRKIGSREGAYGLKMHIPFGTKANIYSYIDTRRINRLDSIAATAKFEFLVGGTEMAMSIWGKKGNKPVYAFDASGSLWNFLLCGEIALFQEFTINKVSFNGEIPAFSSEVKNWLPRMSAGISRYFTVNGVPDRLMTTVEFYYNQPGSDLEDFPIPDDVVLNDTLAAILIAGGLYEPNNFSRFYLSLFSSFSRFILSDMTLSVNAIGNLNQKCAMVTGALSYNSIHNFSLELLCTGYFGAKKTEYTITGDGLQVQLTAGVAF